jgi:uncharacterized lipoprotein YddW (UPF0748 family)
MAIPLSLRSLLFVSLSLLPLILVGQSPPKHELRGAWIATFANIDWPSANTLSVAAQQAELIRLLDQLQAAGINAVFFQVRSQCDAMYESPMEPWSADLTGRQGQAPSPAYDPLEFLIAACRQRGLEVHAWFNPFRAVSNAGSLASFAPNHIARTRPEWLLAQGSLRILDPGIPQVRDYVVGVVLDVLRRYDVDGIHFDDYFYPYPPSSGAPFNDDASFAADARGFTNRQDWRRDNIDLFIQRTNESVRAVKPWVKFGVSPFGIWRNRTSDPGGSATNGLQSYSDIYADSRKWIQQAWVDYLTPQLYWSVGFSVANYGILLPWWNALGGSRHVYSGMAAYKVNNGGTDTNWNQPSQIPNQVRLNRQHAQVRGQTFFSARSVVSNPLGIRDALRDDLFRTPALLPRMPWKDDQPPPPVGNLTAQTRGNEVRLSWVAPPATGNALDRVRQFVVYRSTSSMIDRDDSANIVRLTANESETSFSDPGLAPGTYYYTVTALDRLHNESLPAATVSAQVAANSGGTPGGATDRPAGSFSRLTNLSVLAPIRAAGDSFTVGFVVGGSGTSGTKPVVLRAAGPSLAQLGVSGVLPDPLLERFAGSTRTGENDNWGGGAALSSAMSAVGAFAFSGPASPDAAASVAVPAGDQSMRISGVGGGTGLVLAEVYDATPDAAYTAMTPRLINVSLLKDSSGGITVGFVVAGGGEKRVLVRAVGPTLSALGVSGAAADPRLNLFAGAREIGANDNWGGRAELVAAGAQAGAFALPSNSRDAALVASLPAGNYTVRVETGDATGTVLVEVYELP